MRRGSKDPYVFSNSIDGIDATFHYPENKFVT